MKTNNPYFGIMKTNKPYFAKYLPVKGEIEENDLMFMIGSPTLLQAGGDNFNSGAYIKVKLFLCSRDIQVGDKVIQVHPNPKVTKPTYPEGEYIFKKGDFKDNSVFKVIGEISPEAIWAREGDEFDETEIKKIALIDDDNLLNNPIWIEGRENQGYKMLILIKGPCGHFH